MIPYLIGAAVVIGVKVAMDHFSQQERDAYKKWHSKRKEVQRTIEEHERNIEKHIRAAERSYNYHFLVDLHYSSVQIANEAYKLLKQVDVSIGAIQEILYKYYHAKRKWEKKQFYCKSKYKKAEFEQKIQEINEMIQPFSTEKNNLYHQKKEFNQKLFDLNKQTANLKYAIRDRCGCKGEIWYKRLEERKKAR